MRLLQSHCRAIVVLSLGVYMAVLNGCGGGTTSNRTNPGSVLTAASSSLAFGSISKNKSSQLTDTITNVGSSSIAISAANVSGAGFSVSGLSLPLTLSAHGSVTFTVTFSPVATGSVDGMLAIVSTATNPTTNIALSGTEAAQGTLAISPGTLNFGSVVVGTTSSLTGTVAASGSSVTIFTANSDSAEFVLSGISLPVTLAPGEMASFKVMFDPATSGFASATLLFSSDASNSQGKQPLRGTGTTAAAHSVDLNWEPSSGLGVTGYNIYRGNTSSGPYSKINPVLEPTTTYTDSGVAAGHVYYYVTTAVTVDEAESEYSNQVSAVIPTS